MRGVDVLVRIKRLVIARRVEFTMKATEERLRDGLSIEDVLESIVNANAIRRCCAHGRWDGSRHASGCT